jgi:hypothetical protein
MERNRGSEHASFRPQPCPPERVRERARSVTRNVVFGTIISFGLSDERATENAPIKPLCPFLSPRQTQYL